VSAPENRQSHDPLADHNRQTSLLFQGLSCELHLFFEALKLRLDQLSHERRAHLEQQFQELRMCTLDAYAHLSARIERLERRVRDR
jgi:hypothetical protein